MSSEIRAEEITQPVGTIMRTLPVFVTLLLTAALAYYIYTPLPDAIQEPWRLMVLDTAVRTAMNLVSYKPTFHPLKLHLHFVIPAQPDWSPSSI